MALDDEFPGEIEASFTKDPGATGNFEITLDGKLVHSKSKNGQGRCEDAAEREKLFEIIRKFKDSM